MKKGIGKGYLKTKQDIKNLKHLYYGYNQYNMLLSNTW